MADDVQPQQEGMKTLHLRLLRIQWQVVTLQLISTIALLWMYLKMVDLYIVDSIDHAMAIQFFDTQLNSASLEMPLPAWLTGEDAIGIGRFYPIMVLSIVIGGGMAALTFQNPVIQRRIRLGLLLAFVLWLFGPFLIKWLFSNFGKGEWWIPPDESVESLFKGVIVVLEVILIGIYILPLVMGIRGVWGLSKGAIAWATGIMLLFLILHALLTFQIVEDLLFGVSGDGLKKIPSLAGEPTIMGLISPNHTLWCNNNHSIRFPYTAFIYCCSITRRWSMGVSNSRVYRIRINIWFSDFSIIVLIVISRFKIYFTVAKN